MSYIIWNCTLYALGVVLIKLWSGKSFLDLHKHADGVADTGMPQADFMTE